MICRTYDIPGGTLAQYEAVVERTGTDKPDGVHTHIAGKTENGFKVIEVWDSEDQIDSYMERNLGEAIQAVMVDAGLPRPTITDIEVHRLDWLG